MRTLHAIFAICLLAASAPLAALKPGVGYKPPHYRSSFRAEVAGRVCTGSGSELPDPWVEACGTDQGGLDLACLRAVNFFRDDKPKARLAYCKHYGVCLRTVLGGWAGGLSSENAKRLPEALKYWFKNDPARLRSPGAAGGFDGIPTGTEFTDALAFGEGIRLFNDWCRATQECRPQAGFKGAARA